MRKFLVVLLVALALSAALAGTIAISPASARQQRTIPGRPALRVRPVTWTEAKPIVERLSDALPISLRNIPESERASRWPAWVDEQRTAVAARISQGSDDSLVNLLLFGTSFTTEPRITSTLLADLDRRWNAGDRSAQDTLMRAYRRRTTDLVDALAKPGSDERLRFGRAILEQRGHTLSTEAGRRAASDYLLANVVRVRQEAAALARELEAVRALPDPTAAFAERSRVFRQRGLAPDSSVLTQFAVDRALCALRDRGTIPSGSVKRVAIVGPGLDFADKQEGFDFYAPQSLQPFTTMDSLLRCGLATPDAVRVTTFDVSPRVNEHLRAAIARAATNRAAYRLVLPWSSGKEWGEGAVDYWRRAGDRIGKAFDVTTPSALGGVRARDVDVRPEIVRKLAVTDGNIALDRVDLPEAERFDLVVATNVLVYYDTFEQTLALASIAGMLRPGGLLLTNDALLEIPEIPLKSDGYLTVQFSERDGDGERMVWYVRARSTVRRRGCRP
jgi:CheR methyltransferase, SAM binding domain